MKTTRLSAFAIFVLLAFIGALSANDKEKDQSESENEVTVEKMILAKDAGEASFVPVKKFKPTDTFGVLLRLSEAKEGTKVKGVWTIVDAGGMHDKKIAEEVLELTPKAIKSTNDPSQLNFFLHHHDPFPTGHYKFDVYLNGKLTDTFEFAIEE